VQHIHRVQGPGVDGILQRACGGGRHRGELYPADARPADLLAQNLLAQEPRQLETLRRDRQAFEQALPKIGRRLDSRQRL